MLAFLAAEEDVESPPFSFSSRSTKGEEEEGVDAVKMRPKVGASGRKSKVVAYSSLVSVLRSSSRARADDGDDRDGGGARPTRLLMLLLLGSSNSGELVVTENGAAEDAETEEGASVGPEEEEAAILSMEIFDDERR